MTGIGDVVRRVREEQGLTQTELAEKTGISRARISQIEGGRVALPNVGHRRALAKALGISNIDLLIAAHELDDDELILAGVEGRVEPHPDDWAVKLRDALNLVYWDANPAMAKLVLDIIEGVRSDQAMARETRRSAGRPPSMPR